MNPNFIFLLVIMSPFSLNAVDFGESKSSKTLITLQRMQMQDRSPSYNLGNRLYQQIKTIEWSAGRYEPKRRPLEQCLSEDRLEAGFSRFVCRLDELEESKICLDIPGSQDFMSMGEASKYDLGQDANFNIGDIFCWAVKHNSSVGT